MPAQTQIDCPACGSVISITPLLLMQGTSFSCSNAKCDASISLSDSGINAATEAINEYEKLSNSNK